MLNCRACLWRCIRALDTSSSTSYNLRRDAVSVIARGQQRSIKSSTRAVGRFQPEFRTDVDKLARSEDEPWKKSVQAVKQKERARDELKRVPASTGGSGKEMDGSSPWMGKRDPSMSTSEWDRRRKELQYLRDPLDLANFVKKELGKGKSTEMLQLVRMASHSMQCIVSWNHIIDNLMGKERVTDALKVYNEMKKRAQFPDSYTYTIVLRGLSINAHNSGVLSKALTVYHSMSAPNSRVEPTIMHTNAVLTVCARTLDMDALWGIAGKIPESGPAAANAITFTLILNAIRQSLLVDVPKGESEEETATRRERGIVEGRRLWENIVSKWRSADIVIEEELVCAMGRLLLVGSRPRDWDDVLSLVEQTMDIPRLVPRLGTPARYEAGLQHIRAPNTPEQYRIDDDHLGPDQGPVRGDEFLTLAPHDGFGSVVSNPLTYATPGTNTLSMLQEACQKVVAAKAADEYWDMLTDPMTYGVVPDFNNLHTRLRVLRQNRASGKAVELLKNDLIGKGFTAKPGTFRLAMSTCVRDKNNHNVLKHANQILHLMMTTLPDADTKTVLRYAELALHFPLAKGEDIVNALTFLHPVVKSIRLQLGVGAERKFGRAGAVYLTGDEKQTALTALGKVYGIYDRLLLSNMIPEEQKAPFKAERAILSVFIQRATFKGTHKKWEYAQEALDAPEGTSVKKDEGAKDCLSGSRRARNALPAEKRRPWFSALGASDSA